MTADPELREGRPPLRADARRNRDQILQAARKLFGERGPEAPMEEIAKAAGVGVGTLYRRFPDREALIRAVAEDAFGFLNEAAHLAKREESSGWDALVRLLSQTKRLQVSVQLAMLSARAQAILRDDPEINRLRLDLLDVLDELVRAAQAEGSMREDVGTGDVAILASSLLLRKPQDASEEFVRLAPERCLVLMLDGLRARPGSPLPGRALTSDDLFQSRRKP
ncbi:TetR/AcrR family transcriptional regulator [Amycolatopsis anabasis]|uniref:TetR/AcrR family transcriptional regulator n=1 Tax=Amycolatopsis anabasis TaxID=1840409 RepID=UPI00131CE7EA|nr:TetR/AcrR family transcriptional regulator [Amycolatopsis anabasis]